MDGGRMTDAEKIAYLKFLLAQAIQWNWIDLDEQLFEMPEEDVADALPDLMILRNKILDEIGGFA
jgi:hypothetical protein